MPSTPRAGEPPVADEAHEWVSFEIGDETVTFDLTFLASSWRCLYGDGCPGILDHPAPELEHGCCTHGAHFTTKRDRRRVAELIDRLTDDEWQLKGVADELGGPITKDADQGAWVTRTHEGACVLLNRPGWPAGAGCALHQAAVRRGERPLDWKPYVCWQLPLRAEYHTDDNGHVTTMLRDWKRRDWGEGGAEFHWWCTEAPEAFTGAEPVYRALRDDIVALVGRPAYDALVTYLDRRAGIQVLPHPAVRRRTLNSDA
jgi:hypothetical protein